MCSKVQSFTLYSLQSSELHIICARKLRAPHYMCSKVQSFTLYSLQSSELHIICARKLRAPHYMCSKAQSSTLYVLESSELHIILYVLESSELHFICAKNQEDRHIYLRPGSLTLFLLKISHSGVTCTRKVRH